MRAGGLAPSELADGPGASTLAGPSVAAEPLPDDARQFEGDGYPDCREDDGEDEEDDAQSDRCETDDEEDEEEDERVEPAPSDGGADARRVGGYRVRHLAESVAHAGGDDGNGFSRTPRGDAVRSLRRD